MVFQHMVVGQKAEGTRDQNNWSLQAQLEKSSRGCVEWSNWQVIAFWYFFLQYVQIRSAGPKDLKELAG